MKATGYNITSIYQNVTFYIFELKSKFCHVISIFNYRLLKHSQNFIIDKNIKGGGVYNPPFFVLKVL